MIAAGGSEPRPASRGDAAAPRLHWVDWLRVAAIGAVFVYHSLRPFNVDDWHIKNAETSDVLNVAMGFFSTFGLAVLFLLAGIGTRFALRRRTPATFLRERTARLLVPFVVGTLLLSPVQAFLEATHKGTFDGGFVDYLATWASSAADRLTSSFTPAITGVGYHLWFLGFLFLFSVLALPICEALLGRRGRAFVATVAGWMRVPGASLALAIPIAVLIMVAFPFGRAEHDWLEFGWYLAYYLVGFVLVSDDRFLAAVRRDAWPALVVGLVSATGLIVTDFFGWVASYPTRGVYATVPFMASLFAIEGWAWTLVVLNVGLRLRALQRPLDPRLGDAVLPLYVIHQPVIVAVAFVVVQWPLGILPKWAIVFTVSAAVTLVLVALALRTPLTRVLVGARVRPGGGLAPATAEATSALLAGAGPQSTPRQPRPPRRPRGARHAHP